MIRIVVHLFMLMHSWAHTVLTCDSDTIDSRERSISEDIEDICKYSIFTDIFQPEK